VGLQPDRTDPGWGLFIFELPDGQLVARGRDFPLARIAERLRCPRCGCRRIAVVFGPPSSSGVNYAVARSYGWRE